LSAQANGTNSAQIEGLEALLSHQLSLMSKQLRLLQEIPTQAPIPSGTALERREIPSSALPSVPRNVNATNGSLMQENIKSRATSQLEEKPRPAGNSQTDSTIGKLKAVSARQQPVPAFDGPTECTPSEVQRGMWMSAQMTPEASAASNGSDIVELSGKVNVPVLERAIADVVNRHEALRATFSEDGSKILIQPLGNLELLVHDLSSLPSVEAAAQLTEILERDAQQVFDLAKGPLASFSLIKLSVEKHLLVFTAQMIICDGWSFAVVLEEVSALYSAYLGADEVSLDQPRQMREYALWKAQKEGVALAEACEAFWLAQYRTLPPRFDLPTSQPRPRVRTYEAARVIHRLAPDFYEDLRRTARELANTPFSLLLTAFAIWLYRLSGIHDFVIGVPVSGQGALGFDKLVGQCVHTLPIRFRIDEAVSFSDELERTRHAILDAQEHWNTDFGSLSQKLNVPNDPSRMPLVPVLFNLDPPMRGMQFAGCNSRVTAGPRLFFHFDLGLNIVDEGETFRMEFDYNANLFDSNTIRQWVGGFQNLLEGIVSNPKYTLAQLPMLAAAEQGKIPAELRTQRGSSVSSARSNPKTDPNTHISPKSETEKRLAKLWCETLSLEKVSATDNFFELGGRSLTAVSLFSKIEIEFGKKLPLTTLFTSPTVRKLAAVLQGSDTREPWSLLVPIQPKGSNKPLFLVHGAGGNVLLYRSLGEQLAPDFPLYGLQSVGLDGESKPLHTIEEMAVRYLREVRQVQPRGPYYLGGYCLGGTIAYEMAQILRAEGEEVPLVAMLDTYNFSRALRVRFSSFLMEKAKFHLANLFSLDHKSLMKYLQEKIRLVRDGELANLRSSAPGGGRPAGMSRASGGLEGAIQSINDNACEIYNPRPYAGRVTLFKPRFNYKFYPDPLMGWGDLVQGGLEIIEVSVNPHSMLIEPNVNFLAEKLKECISGELRGDNAAIPDDPSFEDSLFELDSKDSTLHQVSAVRVYNGNERA
jgi:thioesterase domain-containing protein/acyl carrier protein